MNDPIRVLKLRTQHHDPDVRLISSALLEHLRLFPNGWVAQAILSPQMSVYKNPLEKALVLEKTVIHHFLQDFWLSSIGEPPPTPDSLSQIREKYQAVMQSGWLQLIMDITPTESSLILGKPIQTNRIARYHNLFKKVILPLLSDRNPKSKLTVLDAGSSSGLGSHAAKTHYLPIKSWFGVDKEDPRVNLPWILTCSTRLGEITSDQFSQTLKLMLNLPKNTRGLRGDIENLPQSLASDSIDLYIAIFSFYQLQNPSKAYREALRVLKPGGLLIITDHILRTGPRTYRFISPDHKIPLLTLAFHKITTEKVELLNIYRWRDTDLTEGQTIKLKINDSFPVSITLHNSHL